MISAFAYLSPKTIEQAVSDLSDTPGKSEILAGGSDLLALLKERIVTPERVVNIKDVKELGGIEIKDGQVRIGANVTLSELAGNASVQKHVPALAKAARDIGSIQIRNVATIGGNLCQRNRDWYFRNGLNPEVKEELQYSAIFPIDGQLYVHPSTLAPVLIACGAMVEVMGMKKMQKIPVEKLFQVANGKDQRETVLAPNEIVLAVTVPVVALATGEIEIRERLSHDWPLVQAAAALELDGDVVKKASIILGHVAPLPIRATAAQKAIEGKKVDEATAAAAGKAAVEGAQAAPKNEYKLPLVQVAVKRALMAAVGNEYWRAS